MAYLRTTIQIFIGIISFNVSLIASGPLVSQPGATNAITGIINSTGTTMEALTKLRMLDMFSRQNLSSEEIACLQPFRYVISLLSGNRLDEQQKQAIISEAWAECSKDKNTSNEHFWGKVKTIVLDPSKNYMSDQDRESMQRDMAQSLIGQARQITHPITTILENAVTIGIAMGIVDCMQKVIGESCSRVVNKIPSMFAFMNRIAGKGYNTLCRRPDPLQPEEVLIWEQSFECLINSLCEHNVSGNLMLKNIRVSDDDQAAIAVDTNWLFLSQTIGQMCGHINEFFQERLPYYTGCKHQQKLLVGLSNAVSVENRTSIAFVMNMIMNNLKQLVEVCERAQNSDDLDRVHVKKLGRITLLLFNKLRVMIGGTATGSVNTVGAAYQSNSGLIEH